MSLSQNCHIPRLISNKARRYIPDAIKKLMPSDVQRHIGDGRNGSKPNIGRGEKNGMHFGDRTNGRFTPLMDAEEL